MPVEQPLPYEHGLQDFLDTIAAAQRDITQAVMQAIQEDRLHTARLRAEQLRKVLEIVDELGARTDPQARQLVADAFGQSAAQTATQIAGLAINAPEIPGAFAGISSQAVTALQDAITGRLEAARVQIGRQVDDLYARAGRRAALRAVLGADASPQSAARQLAHDLLHQRQVQQLMREAGVGFVDAAGRGWKLETYSAMVTRTVTRQAVVEGAIARMGAHGITVARVSIHAKPCPICATWQGRLVSLTDQTGEHQGEAVTALGSLPNGGPPMHPNCRHTLMPVSTELDALRAEKQPPPAQLPPATDETPQTASNVLDPDKPVKKIVDHATAQIDKVHGTSGMASVLVKRRVGGKPSQKGRYVPADARIDVRITDRSELTTIHEFAHAMDHLLFGDRTSRQPGAVVLATHNEDPRFQALMAAMDRSRLIRKLKQLETDTKNADTRRFVRYLLTPWEQFARAYAQWVTLRSGDAKLAAQLVAKRHGAYVQDQWDDDDFKAIAKELDGLFRAEGLLR